MKKILFCLTLIGGLISAQNPELFSNSWYISQIQISGQTTNSPAMSQSIVSSSFMQNGSLYTFSSRYFNTAGVQIVFSPTQNSFTKTDGGCTLVDYWGSNWQNARPYDQKNCDFYLFANGTVFNYEILNNGTAKTLIITNPTNGNQVFYNNSFLSTKEASVKKAFKIFPNPVSEFAMIDSVEKNLALKIYDISGKILFETLTSGQLQKIDMSKFPKGQYILSIENHTSEFIIKK
ncbi:T9SS type A sorting domain-containing protein [Chryseobacterium echinoideorum]|uniref:T9SS type A sorting domain-containing protein n=1 Tax=Chryseobacterium echinoideorum TaxID=1549648 RepID=UPI001626D55F|nr:T9SS type A sorting domain-containing protein [Chryseobacterium echinoideorum]